MQGKIVQYGEGYAIVLDQPTIEQMNISPDTEIDMVMNDNSIIITVKDEERQAKLHSIIKEMHDQYGSVFQRLAE